MEIFTGKRRGRPRKDMDLPVYVEKSQSAPDYSVGDGTIGTPGPAAQANAEGPSWDALVTALKANHSHKTSIAMAYYPEPKDDWIATQVGWVRVTPGEAGYTFNTGETIRL